MGSRRNVTRLDLTSIWDVPSTKNRQCKQLVSKTGGVCWTDINWHSVVDHHAAMSLREIEFKKTLAMPDTVTLCLVSLVFFFGATAPPFPPQVGRDSLIHEVSRSHTTTHHSRVGLLWTSDQLVTETSTWQYTSGVPTNFVRVMVSTNSVADRGQREQGSGGGSPLVRGSGGSCNLVQEISFRIVKFS